MFVKELRVQHVKPEKNFLLHKIHSQQTTTALLFAFKFEKSDSAEDPKHSRIEDENFSCVNFCSEENNDTLQIFPSCFLQRMTNSI